MRTVRLTLLYFWSSLDSIATEIVTPSSPYCFLFLQSDPRPIRVCSGMCILHDLNVDPVL